jgi:membrane associated rhomboid family serine protease/Flp pilus assembly protein TadD
MANCIQCGRQLPGFSFKKLCQWCVQHEAAKRGEDGEDAKQIVMPVPWVRGGQSSITVMHVLFGANVMVFVAMVIATVMSGDSAMEFSGQLRVHFGSNFGPYTLSGQWWRLLTYMFLHGDPMHIAFNMWCLWDLGQLCESLYGRWTFAALYVVAGVAGGVASVGWNPYVNSVGASGAIFGLAGALIASFYLGEFSLPGAAIQGTLKSLVFFVGFNVVWGLFSSGTDNACHAGGLVSGMVMGALIALATPEHDKPLRRVGILMFVFLLVGASALGVERWRGSSMRYRSAILAERNAEHKVSELQTRVKQNPQDASAHYALAGAYFNTGEIPEGISELKRVLELQPQNGRARMDLGAAYLNQQQSKNAQEQFTQLAAQDPNNADAHAGLGMALAEEGNHEAAIPEYKTALLLDPQGRGVYYRMGVSQARLKQYDEAIASYLKERERSGEDADLETALADSYQGKGMTQQAQEARTKAGQLRDQNTD